MDGQEGAGAGGNVDRRLARIEQILPTLATKEDLKPLASKEELREAVAKLEEEVREEGERSRRYMKVLIEDVKDTVALYAERLTVVDERDAKQHAESVAADKALDRRLMPLEAASRRRRS